MSYLTFRAPAAFLAVGICLMSVLAAAPASANGYGEDGSWQFQTPADMANLAAVQSLIQQKQGHMFQPSQTYYNTTNATTIQHQTNCSVSSTAVGNTNTGTASGNSASPTGATASSTGNASSNTASSQTANGLPVNLTNTPSNTGTIGSTSANNTTSASASGSLNQSLNSSQSNAASQTSTQSGNTACLTTNSGSNSGTLN